ncbi:MAG: hypothetical protein AAGK98_02665 [Pseudomonadota bacterium]
MKRHLTLIACLLTLVACATPEGHVGLAISPIEPSSNLNISDLPQASEPLLTLPARIGLARVAGGALTEIPAGELDAWAEMAADLPGVSSADLVSPLLLSSIGTQGDAVLLRIMEAARRQGMDAVLVYDVTSQVRLDNTALAIANLTLIGAALLPTRYIAGEGRADALLLDSRNAYPYLTASAAVRDQSYSVSFGSHGRRDRMRRALAENAVTQLAGAVQQRLRTFAEDYAGPADR